MKRGRAAYEDYISSRAWADRKRAYFRKHKRACHICNATDEIVLHHLTYEHMGHEPDGDLMALCARHHDVVHAFHRLRPDLALRDATMFAIADIRFVRSKPSEVREPPPFTPQRQRSGGQPRPREVIGGGRQDRLNGIPIRVVSPAEAQRSLARRGRGTAR